MYSASSSDSPTRSPLSVTISEQITRFPTSRISPRLDIAEIFGPLYQHSFIVANYMEIPFSDFSPYYVDCVTFQQIIVALQIVFDIQLFGCFVVVYV